MKILIISAEVWRRDNSFGNTYSNIFGNLKNIEIANVYLDDGIPEYEKNISCYYRISQKQLIKNFFKRSIKIGEVVTTECNEYNDLSADKLIGFGKSKRGPLMYMLRDELWHWGNINYKALYQFVKDFSPDLIFLPFYNFKYVYRIGLKICKEFNIPIVGEASIDIYSLKHYSYDPLFWLNRFAIRRLIRKTIKHTSFLYVISSQMKKDYEKYLKIPCKVLYKIPDLSRKKYEYKLRRNKLQFLYTGGIGGGRWKVLSMLARQLEISKLGELHIYSQTEIDNNINESLNIDGVSYLHSPISQEEVIEKQNAADILIHVEDSKKEYIQLIRYSISTKIMDYICTGRCILAIAPPNIASMQLIKNNELGLVANSEEDLINTLDLIKKNKSIVEYYAKRNSSFLTETMNPEKMRDNLYQDLLSVLRNSKK